MEQMRAILTLGAEVFCNRSLWHDLRITGVVVKAVVVGAMDLTDEQKATFDAVLGNEPCMSVVDEWWSLVDRLGIESGDVRALLGLGLMNREAKAIIDKFWSVYDEQRDLGAIPKAAPWFD